MKFLFFLLAAVTANPFPETHSRTRRNPALAPALTAAVLDNPEGFANAINSLGKGTIENAEMVRQMALNLVSSHAIIVNTTGKKVVWYTYNDISPVHWWTNMQSTMGPYATVTVHSLGFGSMHTYADNKGDPFLINRNSMYIYDGESLSWAIRKP